MIKAIYKIAENYANCDDDDDQQTLIRNKILAFRLFRGLGYHHKARELLL